ncbi:hypothetical protein HYALB_00001039 [Hymenoscyphus albidus]|uniref:Uncharacterized protein n=1 Tax=Hymenoscyphus albidus TaxID=595503 RepID=A0A9N9LZM9_9HELO|nr:hypothetical protein HYALB_00001039 [Hymenoscyphus albidus]
MSNFPTLIPAFTTQIVMDPSFSVGSVSKGAPLTIVPFGTTQGAGFIRSEPDYPIKVDAVFEHGSDFIRQDPSGKHLRLDVNSIAKDKSGAMISYKYTGIVTITPEIGAVLTGSPDAKTTSFGSIAAHVLFETGSAELKALEHKVYVGSGHFIIEEGKKNVVEYKISEVLP